MGLDAVVRRKDGAPLGPVEDVTSTLSRTFPGLTFAVGRTERWSGVYQGQDGLLIEFYLGAGPMVSEAQISMYGQTARSSDYFSKIPDWTVDY
jgi:hypothetical protein